MWGGWQDPPADRVAVSRRRGEWRLGMPDEPDEYQVTTGLGERPPWRPSQRPTATESDRVHILIGDARGGGHRHGAGKGKSEFPADWSDDVIMDAVDETLSAPQSVRLQDDGRWLFVRFRYPKYVNVVVDDDPDGRWIVTAFPDDLAPR